MPAITFRGEEIEFQYILGLIIYSIANPLSLPLSYVLTAYIFAYLQRLLFGPGHHAGTPLYYIGLGFLFIVNLAIYIMLLTPKYRRWKQTIGGSIQLFLNTVFIAQLFYFPFVFFDYLIFQSRKVEGGAEVAAFLFIPLYIGGCIVLVPLSNIIFRYLLRKRLNAKLSGGSTS